MPPQPRWRCCSTPSSHRTRRARDPSEAAWRGPHRREDRGRDAQPRQRVRPRDRRDREAARGRRLVIVPGGGPFADAVRQMFNRFGIGEEAAHWMAILGMDQYAHALVARISGAALVEGETEIAATLAAGRIPLRAPCRWLRSADPRPHSWDVTSDSIAA